MEENTHLKIETIKGYGGSEVSICPERGGIITSLKLKGTEILYFDPATFNDRTKNVRGGIPILFPNVGPVADARYPNLPQHGVARVSSQWVMEKNTDGNDFIETLTTDEDTKKLYPYDFVLFISGKFNEDGSFTLVQAVENKESKRELPIAMGIHPYFKVSDSQKKNIKFNFEGGEIATHSIEQWADTIILKNPKVLGGEDSVMEIAIPDLGVLMINASIEYDTIFIWSLPGADFICIEPIMRGLGGFISHPEQIPPGKTYTARATFSLKKTL